MFVEEAQWIRRQLGPDTLRDGASVLDLGSSTAEYRTVVQPHITEMVYRPLQLRGCHITSVDAKAASGVDLVVDLTLPRLPATLAGRTFDLVICGNTLQHVPDREALIGNAVRLVAPSGLLLLTVPRLYPRTTDPIDNLYRPDIAELVRLVRRHAGAEVIAGNVVRIADRQYYRFVAGRMLDYVLLRPVRMRLRWYLPFLRWRVTCVLLRIHEPARVAAEAVAA